MVVDIFILQSAYTFKKDMNLSISPQAIDK